MIKATPMLLWGVIGMAIGVAGFVWADGPIPAPRADLGSDDNPVIVSALPDAIAVDGDPAKWQKIRGLPAPYSKKDSGNLKLGWRGDGIYGLVQVKDDNIQSNSDAPWTADCLELWLETDDGKADGMSTCSTQLVLAPDPQSGPGKAIIDIPSGGIVADDVKAMWKATADGYAIEFFIPAKSLAPAVMRAGTKIGFHYSIDQQGQAIEQFYCEKDTDDSYKTPRNWGTIQLAAAARPGRGPMQAPQSMISPTSAPPSHLAGAAESSINVEPDQGMILYDVRDVDEKLNLAREMERRKDWDQAADRYEQLLVQFGSRAFPQTFDDDGHAVTYGNFGQYLQGCIAHWPINGLDSYRQKFDTPASNLFASAGSDDLATLDRVCSLYFCTPSGKQAAMRMMEVQMEAGEFTAAALVGDRLLDQYPDLGADRPMVLFRTALAWCYGGVPHDAADRADELRKKFPAATNIVRGHPMNLADALTRELASRPAAEESPEAGPPIGGILSVARLGNSDIMPGQRLYRIAVDAPTLASVGPPDTNASRWGDGRTLGIIPTVDRGQLFFQDGDHLFAVDLASGTPLPRWLKTWPKGVFTLAGLTETSRGHQLPVTVTDRLVLAIMGHPDQQAQDEMRMTGDDPPRNLGNYTGEPTLVCLDRDTGARLWTTVLSQLPDLAADARPMQMIGSPLVVGPEVLVTARGTSRLGDEEKAYVLAFDLHSGKNLWCTFIAGHAPLFTTSFNSRSIPAEQAETATHLAYANGMVYVQSNLGALAALDPWVGHIRWLDIFPIGRTQPKDITDRTWGAHRPRPFDHKPWTYNPVVITAGRLFTMPTEGQLLHICDAITGREIKRIDLARLRRRFPDPGSREFMPTMRSSSFDTLVGIRGDQLIISSDRTLCCVNWKRYNPAVQEPFAEGVTVWAVLLPTQTRGRPYLTDRQLLVPCQDRLYRLDPTTGKTIDAFPSTPDKLWTPPDEPGNVLATTHHIVIAGADAVTVYQAR